MGFLDKVKTTKETTGLAKTGSGFLNNVSFNKTTKPAPIETPNLAPRNPSTEELLNTNLALPKSSISQAPAVTPKKETILTKVAKAVLPRSLEVKLGLSEPNIQEAMMTREKQYEQTPVFKQKAVDFAYKELKKDEVANGGFLGTLKDTFIPTKVINAGESEIVNEARNKINAEYQQEHPVASVVSQAIGAIANLILVRQAGGGFGIEAKVTESAGGLDRLAPTLTRMVGKGLESGSIFGIESFISELLNQAKSKKADVKKLAIETGKGAGTGMALGGAGSLSTLPKRIIASGATMGGITTLESYLDDKKIDSKDLVNIAINTLVGAGFELVGGTKKTEFYKAEEMQSIVKESTIQRILSNNPKLTRAEAEKLSGLLNELNFMTKSGIYQNAPKEVLAQFEKLPADFYERTRTQKAQYFNKVSEQVSSGKTVAEAIDIANGKAEIPAEGVNYAGALAKSSQEYKTTAIGQMNSAALRDLVELTEQPEVKKLVQDQVWSAIESGEVKTNPDGTITLYRFGEPRSTRLISATYDKNYADNFPQEGKEMIEFTVRPEDIKVFIGKDESEVLVKPEAIPRTEAKPETKIEFAKGQKEVSENTKEPELAKKNDLAQQFVPKGGMFNIFRGKTYKEVLDYASRNSDYYLPSTEKDLVKSIESGGGIISGIDTPITLKNAEGGSITLTPTQARYFLNNKEKYEITAPLKKETVPPLDTKPRPATPETALAQEAKKYKSAEEFVNKLDFNKEIDRKDSNILKMISNGEDMNNKELILFRGVEAGKPNTINLTPKGKGTYGGYYFTESRDYASDYGNITLNRVKTGRALVGDDWESAYEKVTGHGWTDADYNKADASGMYLERKLAVAAKRAGYDTIVLDSPGGPGSPPEVISLNPNNFEQISDKQLTDIWNKANSELPELPKITPKRVPKTERMLEAVQETIPTEGTLFQEARKYKSAEEFMKDFDKKTAKINELAFKDTPEQIPKEAQNLHDAFMDYVQNPEIQKIYEQGGNDTKVLTDIWNKANAEQAFEKGGRNLMEIENGDLTVSELKKKLEIAIEGKEVKSAPSGNGQGNIAVFNADTPILMGGIENIRPIQIPELVSLVEELTGKVPVINKRLRSKLGVFWGRGQGEIQLRPDIFKDPIQVAKTLAHEIGHLVDWLPKSTDKRRSLLQKLYILKNHLKTEFGEETVSNKEVRAELYALSSYWRPLGDNPSAKYLQYRNSGNELYADAISVLFNSPGLLEQRAPIFYKQFFATLDEKPDVNVAYWELQDMLRGAKEELYQARENRIKGAFQKATDIQKGFSNKKEKADKRLVERLRQQLDDRYYPALKKVQEAEARGVVIDDNTNPKYLFQELSYVNNDNYLLADKLDREVSKPIKEAGMNDDDIGTYLLLNRIQTGRKEIANPFGFDVNTATEQLEYLKQRVGETNFKLLQDKVKLFHDVVFKSVEKAVEVGSYNKELYETTIKPNKENYATFAVVDYLQDYVPAGVKKQIGTLKDVANPYHLTILKTAALNKLNAIQEAKNAMRDLLIKEFPAEIVRSKELRSGKIGIFKPNKDEKLSGQLTLLEDGKLKSYDVDPYIAASFNYDHPEVLEVATNLLGKMNQAFKSIVTTYNLGFALGFNPIRDFKRNYKNIQSTTFLGLIKAYFKSFPSAVRYAKGKLDKVTSQMVEDKLISAPIYDYNFDPRDDGMGQILMKYGVIAKDAPESKLPEGMVKARKFILKPVIKLLEAIRFAANTFESVSKIAATKVRIAGGETGKELSYNVRNFSGTPNWKVRGTATYITNEIFIFSNIMKEGLKSDLIIATNPKTRSGFWWRTVKMDYLPKLLMFLAGAGLFGEEIKKLYDNMSEYDKTNYITIPLGKAGDKTVYARIPHDETARLTSAMLWKALNFLKDRDAKGLQDILAIGAGQMPNMTPVIAILQAWGQYLTGRNPYDSFRGRTLIDDTTFQAGGMDSLKKMVEWTANTFGLSQFTTYDPIKNTTLETTVQILPLVNRLIKISNYGMTEQSKELQNKIKTERAREILDERSVINKAAKEYSGEYQAGDLDIDSIGEEVVRDILGHDPETEDEIARDKNIRSKLHTALVVGAYDSRVDNLVYATSNKEKVALLRKYQAEMESDKFNELVETLLDERIISGDVYDEIQP